MMSRTLRLSDGGTVHILESGTGDPLVLIHGVGLRAEAWEPQMALLSRTRRVLAVDMPGHGASSPLPDGARLDGFVAWMSAVLRALDCGPVNLAGHSMGALIAAGVAVEHPELIRRLAVLNGVFRRSPEAREAVRARADQIARGEHDPEAPLARWFGNDPSERAVRDRVSGWLRAADPAGYANAYRAFAEGDDLYADRWARIEAPVLVLTGAQDPNSTPGMARSMAAATLRSRLCVVEGHRHMVNLTAPEAVAEALQDWLAMPATFAATREVPVP